MANKYEKTFLDYASKLDAMTENYGEITNYAKSIVEEHNDEACKSLLGKITEVAESSDKYSKEQRQFARAVKDRLIDVYGYKYIKDICNSKGKNKVDDERSLEELLQELNTLVGLNKVKEQVNSLITYQTVQKMRRDRGLHSAKSTLHMAFTGNPGTGKTTVARIVGRVYKQIGLLSKGHFVEVSRTDLIAGYQGQTALKVKSVIDAAKGGVLFIDEAYSITENDHSDSYGRECLTELTKALEDYRDDLVVIVAGYTEPMNIFFESNPGLRSRFNTFIEFDDYSSNELIDILTSICKQNDYVLEDDLKEKLIQYFQQKIDEKKENFANGRLARNVYDNLVMEHAKRVIKIKNPTNEELSLLVEMDFNV